MNKIHMAALSALLLCSTAVQAIGLGDIDVYSALNEPLRAEVEVHGATSPDLTAELLTSNVFTEAHVVKQFTYTEVEFAYNADNKPVIVLTGLVPFTEPFLHFSLSVKSDKDKKRVREYTVLLDPPGTTYRPRAALSAAPIIVAEKTPTPVAPVAPQPETKSWWPDDGGVDIDLTDDGGVDIDLTAGADVYLTRKKPAMKPKKDPALRPESLPVPGQTSQMIPVPAYIQQ